MSKIFKKKSYTAVFLVFLFLLINTILPGFLHNKGNTAYAKSPTLISFKSGGFASHSSTRSSFHSSKSQGGNFKSGSFSKPKSEYKSNNSSSSSSGDFKSGSFSNSTKSDSKSYNKKASNSSSTQNYNNGNNRRSFFPIPIPIPWGHNYNSASSYGQSSLLSRFFWGFVKFIVVIFIINRINKFRKK
mgnify:FL=1